MPGVVKYSDFARKVTLRLTSTGKKNESLKDRWLLARMAGTVVRDVVQAARPRAARARAAPAR